MRSFVRPAVVALLVVLAFVAARQSRSADFYDFGFMKEWQNSQGQTVGYAYKSCDGDYSSEGDTAGPPTSHERWTCDPLVMPADPPCTSFLYVQNSDGSGFQVVLGPHPCGY